MRQIDKELRRAIMDLVWNVGVPHPAARTGHRPSDYECTTCVRVDNLLALLDAEQREYGPPIDVTDPSWLRDHLTPPPCTPQARRWGSE